MLLKCSPPQFTHEVSFYFSWRERDIGQGSMVRWRKGSFVCCRVLKGTVDPRVGDNREKMKLWAPVLADMAAALSIGFLMLEELGGSAMKCSWVLQGPSRACSCSLTLRPLSMGPGDLHSSMLGHGQLDRAANYNQQDKGHSLPAICHCRSWHLFYRLVSRG